MGMRSNALCNDAPTQTAVDRLERSHTEELKSRSWAKAVRRSTTPPFAFVTLELQAGLEAGEQILAPCQDHNWRILLRI